MFDKKILCLGNNGSNTDIQTSILARKNRTVNHGLIESDQCVPAEAGYYHTSILDLPFGAIIDVAKHFDTIVFLDQSQKEWSHWKPLLSTYKIMLELDALGYDTVYKDNRNIQPFKNFDELVNNKSFCIYPWVLLTEDHGYVTLCTRSKKKVTTIDQVVNWKTNADFAQVREAMLRGDPLPDYCSFCYAYESKGIESYRQFETKEWVSKLDLKTVEDLDRIEHPYYYEIRLSNKCNIMCRSCKPEHSHLIDREYKKFNIVYPHPQIFKYSSLDYVDIATLNPRVRVYLTGGEPTIMSEVLNFMEKCITAGRTDFDFTLGTNGVKLSARFLELADQFTNMNFSVSLDGYGPVNDYWRWGSQWDTVIKNTHLLQSRGHNVSINCVPGLYNVTNLHLLFEFLDQEFPHTAIYLQINHVGIQSAYNHPRTDLVVESMERCRNTKIYHSDGKSNRTAIDSLYEYYKSNPSFDPVALKEFFVYNDQLDHTRNVRLADYIPELEECRKYILGD